jgi:hypothetical protein
MQCTFDLSTRRLIQLLRFPVKLEPQHSARRTTPLTPRRSAKRSAAKLAVHYDQDTFLGLDGAGAETGAKEKLGNIGKRGDR